MLTEDNQPKLVELNTIASGLGAVGDKMHGLHEFLIEKYGAPDHSTEGEYHDFLFSCGLLIFKLGILPNDCENIENIVDAMKQAHDLYLSVYKNFDK
jgi:hypothetical protein